MKVQVLYVSQTGNTKEIAKAIYNSIPESSKDIKYLDSPQVDEDVETYFIGFWVNRGTASLEVLDFLSELEGKNVGIFATCGMGKEPKYYREIENNVKAFLSDNNVYLGAYFCQGKMPISVRKKYEDFKNEKNKQMVSTMLHNFDEALLHPNKTDCENAAIYTQNAFKQLEFIRKQELNK